jgi:hypothetical protein
VVSGVTERRGGVIWLRGGVDDHHAVLQSLVNCLSKVYSVYGGSNYKCDDPYLMSRLLTLCRIVAPIFFICLA